MVRGCDEGSLRYVRVLATSVTWVVGMFAVGGTW